MLKNKYIAPPTITIGQKTAVNKAVINPFCSWAKNSNTAITTYTTSTTIYLNLKYDA